MALIIFNFHPEDDTYSPMAVFKDDDTVVTRNPRLKSALESLGDVDSIEDEFNDGQSYSTGRYDENEAMAVLTKAGMV